MATFDNDLRLKEIATGDESGTWGTSTNTNLSLVAEAFSFGTEAITTNANTHTTTIADGATDPGRSLYLKYTGTLDSPCSITLAPNTVSKVWLIENATSGSQDIHIGQGSGTSVTIPNGKVVAVYSDGGGGSANVVSAFSDLEIKNSLRILKTSPGSFTPTVGATNLIIEDTNDSGISIISGNDATGNICFGHVGDPDEGKISYTHDADDQMTFTAGTAFAFKKGSTSLVKIQGSTPTVTIGNGTAEDTKLLFDGNAGDFHVGLDDSSDNLVLGAGTTLGAEPRVEIDKDGGVQIISDAPVNGQLKLSDIGNNADHGILRHDSGVLSLISTQAADTVGSVQIQGASTSGTFTYITFASSGTTTDKDIEITQSSASKSIILRSPNGSRFRITVDNSGNLATAAV